MDLALALLLLWGLLFVPLGLVLHWLVLGEGARVRALPLAPVTGVAASFVVLGALGRLGIDSGDDWLPWTFVAVAAACVIIIWRRGIAWRSREMIGAGLLLLFAVVLVQLPVVGIDGEGPLGYGTTANPVAEVAAIDAAADGPAAKLAVARQARDSADDRPIGFEQFAALTVAIGLDQSSADPKVTSWTAYGLHSAITGMLAVLVCLPLFAFARARGVRWLGLVVLVPLGVLAPAGFLALANGSGAAVASVPFTTAAVFSLLVTRRDRGWWALVVIFGAAIATTAGPLALLPLACIGLAWMFVRSDTYEHLSQHDTPVASVRTLAVTGLAAGLGVFASLSLLGGGELLAWSALHERLLDAVRSWPFGWLDTDLTATGPTGSLETAVWLVGPALLAVAVIFAVVRNERRELGVLAGAIAAAVITAGIGLIDREAGIRLLEFTLLSTSPFLAALAVRAVSLARANGEEQRGGGRSRFGGTGPTVLVVAFVVLSFAATAVTGTRMVHAPSVQIAAAASSDETALIAAGDPWLEFVVDGDRVRGGYADADALSESDTTLADRGTRLQGYDRLVLSSSPLSSDPSLRYRESSDLDSYQVRLFKDQLAGEVDRDPRVDRAQLLQRNYSQTADRPGTEREDPSTDASATGDAPTAGDAQDAVDAAASALEAAPFLRSAARHDPVEGAAPNTRSDQPAGRLLPADDVPTCEVTRDLIESSDGSCEPTQPVLGQGCTPDDVAAVRSPLDRNRPRSAKSNGSQARAQVLTIEPDSLLGRKPPLIGVQCFDVDLDPASAVLLVHLRDVGLILAPEDAQSEGKDGAWEVDRTKGEGGTRGGTTRSTSELNASLDYGQGRLVGNYDLVLEGAFGAGVEIASTLQRLPGESTDDPETQPTAIRTVGGSANGFSEVIRDVPLSGVVKATNSAGTDIELRRLFARPRDLPPSCDVPIALSGGELRELRMESRDPGGGAPVVRPGLTVSVVSVDEGDEDGEGRSARIAVGTYLSKEGLPRHTLVDWTEQFPGGVQVQGCDGLTYTETGSTPAGERAAKDVVEGMAAALGSEQ